jgi:hypothetical protein
MVATMATVTILIAAGCGPEQPPPPEVDGPPVVVAAGDIADCATEDDEATARLVEGIDGATVLTLGDNAYPEGPAEDFAECYEPSWGQFKARTMPSPGNHEYETPGASGYFDYFGKAAGDPGEGYYSYELGSWHIVALNSNCGVGEIRCAPGSPRGCGSKRISCQRRAEVYPCLLPPPAVHFGVVSSWHRTSGESLGDPLRRWRRRGAKRTRPQLPALCPSGPRGEGGSRGWHQAVRGWHRGQEPL